MIENKNTEGCVLSYQSQLIDLFLRYINLNITDAHLRSVFDNFSKVNHCRIKDPTNQYELDISCSPMVLLPANKQQIKENTETSLMMSNFYTVGFDEFEIQLHSQQTSAQVLLVTQLRLTLEFPSIYKTMFQPSRRPNGKLKRIKCSMNCENVNIKLHEKETNILIYAYSHIFGGLDNGYRKWQSLLFEGFTHFWERRQVADHDLKLYIEKYRQYFNSGKTSTSQKELRQLLELESEMSLSLIMSLRRRSLGWIFDESIPKNQETTPLLNYNGDPSDPQVRQDLAMSSYIALRKPYYDDSYATLREIQLYSRKIEKLRINLYAGSRIGENVHCASLIAERAKFSSALLLCRNPEYPHGSIGATDEVCEPLFPWLQCDVGMSNFNISFDSNEDRFPSVFLETQHGCYSHDIDKWQGNIDFSCESTGATTLRIECRDTVFNGRMSAEILHTLSVLSSIWYSPFPLPNISLQDYFPAACADNEDSVADSGTRINVQSVEPINTFLILKNIVFAGIIHFSNVVILFPDLESFPEATSVELHSNFPASFAMRYDLSFRVLSGHQKEEWNVSIYRVEFRLLPCMYFPLRSRIYGHYQWIDHQNDRTAPSLIVFEKIEAKYQVRVDDRTLRDRAKLDIHRIIHQGWGNFKSRLSIMIESVFLLEYAGGHIISTLTMPTIDVRIKHLENDQKLAPTVHLTSSTRNTRCPEFHDVAQFLLDDTWSYSADFSSKQSPPYLVEILLIDDSSKDRKLIAWCQIPMSNFDHSKSSSTFSLIESDTRIDIGHIR